jgi:hypothetical protein
MKALVPTGKIVLGIGIAAALAGCGGGGGGGADDIYVFRTEGDDRYARIDRMGEPAIASALLSRNVNAPTPVDGGGRPVNPGAGNRFNDFDDQRDALNRGDPVNDARDFAFMLTMGPQINALANYHYKLGPQLRSLGLTPCSVETASPPTGIAQVDISACVAQVAPAVLPDVVTYDPNAPAGWPNGRSFDDPVVDRLLALALLKVSGPDAPHTLNTLVGVLSPAADETGRPSPMTFPHLRDAHPFF